MRARQELPLLERAAVDRVGEQVRPDAAVVEQRVALARGAVAGHGPAFAGRGEQEPEQVALDLQHRGREALVTGHGVQAGGLLRVEHRLHPLGRLTAALLRAGVDPQRAAVRVEFVHVDHPQPGRGQRARGGQQGQVGEVLVVDRVVLPPLDQAEQVRELQRHHALVLDQRAQARREASDVGHMGEDVVRGHQIGPAVLPRDLATGLGAEELDLRPDAPGAGRLGHVRGRLDAEHRDALGLEVLEQVAVVARHLGDQAVRGQTQPLDHRLRVALRVRHP